ncbi:hypothetical protein ABZ370_15870 [Streptomyces sp. NPDC005962]|uniref:hypothetical protein n=1 Tax=Streptomyces sp. NPDC005962 TaxID=3154466 RepID=UPI0033C66AC4
MHQLRHRAVCQVLADGGTLGEVAQLLGHHGADTMAIYADPRHGGAGTGGAPLADCGRAVNGIRDGTERYLTIRRSLGCKLKVEGRMLGQSVGFLEERGDSRLTVQAALEWSVLPHSADPAWWAARLTVIREFARFLAAFDELTEIPPPGLLLRSTGRTTPPYPYSQAEITALIQAARHLAHPLRAATPTWRGAP